MNELDIYIIPSWTYSKLIKNKLNIMDISNYSKIRNFLSLDDITEWASINDYIEIKNNKSIVVSFLSTKQLFSNNIANNTNFIGNTLTPDQMNEVSANILPLSKNKNNIEAASCRLLATDKVQNASDISDNLIMYKFIKNESNIFLILYEGFLTKIKDPKFSHSFISDYLKQCYNMAPIHKVSELSIFRLYVEQCFN